MRAPRLREKSSKKFFPPFYAVDMLCARAERGRTRPKGERGRHTAPGRCVCVCVCTEHFSTDTTSSIWITRPNISQPSSRITLIYHSVCSRTIADRL